VEIEIKRYCQNDKSNWNDFLSSSKVNIFQFDRNFMEYHADRFEDHSLLIYVNGKLSGLFPASQHGDSIVSHGGLTFGGLISDVKMKGAILLQVVENLKKYYAQLGFSKLTYKSVPYIFSTLPNEEHLYALTRAGFALIRRDLSSAIRLSNIPKYNKGRKWIINKAKKSDVLIKESEELEAFHDILTTALGKHGAAPVHTVDELKLLKSSFPDGIKLYLSYLNDEVIAGALLFDYGPVVHTQYLATTETGKEFGGLDLLLHTLTKEKFSNREYLSFGISTENQGLELNQGLLSQKEGFGGRGIVHDFYMVDLNG
jgi:hypothetical protein